MRLFALLILLYTLSSTAQDTTAIDSEIATKKGKLVTYKYKSAATGSTEKSSLKDGQWSYYDKDGLLLKTEIYVNQGSSSYLQGDQIFYNYEGEKILVRSYDNNRLKKETAYLPGVLILKKDTLNIVQVGDFVFIDYPKQIDLTWFNYSNVLKINTIEDPNAPQKLAKYKAFEDSIGNANLLQNATYTIRHPDNVIANPSFEKHPTIERSLTSFSDEITNWLPSSGTPDFFVTPAAARGGISFVGIRIYSISKDIEYVQNKLNHTLLKDQKYCFSAYVKLGPSSLATDAFGVFFSPNAVQFKNLANTDIKPNLSLNKEFLTYKSRWMVLQSVYTAKGNENWMSIGSFKPIENVRLMQIPGGGDSYYYIDDVSLVPIASDDECPCNFSSNTPNENVKLNTGRQDLRLELLTMSVGDKLVLENVYFGIDKYQLLPLSLETLDNLYDVLLRYPALKIEISGHTSTTGDYDHNIQLSKNRASAVLQYLVDQGISSTRLTKAGYGPDLPIAPNDTEQNRQLNRRVEVKIVER